MEAQETLKAQRFELVDAAGRPKAALETGKAGEPILRFADSEGKPRIDMRVTDAGVPSLAFADAAGNPRMSLTMSKDDIPAFGMHGASGQPNILLAIHPDGTPTISLSDKSGDAVANATVITSSDGATIVVSTRDGTPRAALKFDAQGQTQLGLFDKSGQLTWANRSPQSHVAAQETAQSPEAAGKRAHEEKESAGLAPSPPGETAAPPQNVQAPEEERTAQPSQ